MIRNQRQRPLRSRRFKALIAGLALLMLVLGLSGVRSTLAGWTDSDKATGAFVAGSIGPVQNLKCINQGVGGLLTNKVKLEWGAPQSPGPVPNEYQIIVKKTTVVTGTVTTETFSTSQLTYTYTDSKLVNISNYVLTVQQKSKTSGWLGKQQSVNASGIAVLLGVTMVCGK